MTYSPEDAANAVIPIAESIAKSIEEFLATVDWHLEEDVEVCMSLPEEFKFTTWTDQRTANMLLEELLEGRNIAAFIGKPLPSDASSPAWLAMTFKA